MRNLLRRSLDALLLRSDPFSEVEVEVECDCPSCRFDSEVERLTLAHIVAAVLTADDLDSALARAALVREAIDFAVSTAHESMLDPAARAEVDALDSLYDAPAYGEDGWSMS